MRNPDTSTGDSFKAPLWRGVGGRVVVKDNN